MKIDYLHARRLMNGARSQAVDGTILAKSASQKDKEQALQLVMGNLKAKMKTKECIIITIETQ